MIRAEFVPAAYNFREVSVRSETFFAGQTPPYPRSTSGHEVLPLGQGGRTAKLVSLTVDEMAFLVSRLMGAGHGLTLLAAPFYR